MIDCRKCGPIGRLRIVVLVLGDRTGAEFLPDTLDLGDAPVHAADARVMSRQNWKVSVVSGRNAVPNSVGSGTMVRPSR